MYPVQLNMDIEPTSRVVEKGVGHCLQVERFLAPISIEYLPRRHLLHTFALCPVAVPEDAYVPIWHVRQLV